MISDDDKLAGLTLLYEEFSREDAHFRRINPTLDDFLGDMLDRKFDVATYSNEQGLAGALAYSPPRQPRRHGIFCFFAVSQAAKGSGGLIFRMLARHVMVRHRCPFVVYVRGSDGVMADYHLRLGARREALGAFRYDALGD